MSASGRSWSLSALISVPGADAFCRYDREIAAARSEIQTATHGIQMTSSYDRNAKEAYFEQREKFQVSAPYITPHVVDLASSDIGKIWSETDR